ncbi:MAG: FAD-dependent oxidoreductase [Thermodesulfobacteriota bacterium]|jgi:NADPH-dependent 2,4-dienoyl-CoA reductase/sulfur reductase-like enzyme/rhodanese-related sulfurtransferase
MMKRLLVIGGVASGPKAAARARRCDPEMEIVLYQEEDDISYAGCGLPYYISGVIEEREDLISRTPGKFALEGIKILKNRRIEKIDIPNRAVSGRKIGSGETFTDHFDRLVLATGAYPIRPQIDGINLSNVFYLRSIFDADAIFEQIRSEGIRNVVIAGGGYIGLEMAESLVHLGKNVTIVELAPQILTLFDEDFAGVLRQYLEKKGVKIFTSEGIHALKGKGGKVTHVQTMSREIEADAVLMSLGIRPQVELAKQAGLKMGETGAIWVNEKMETSAEGVYAAGDCAETTHLIAGKKVWIPLGSTANKQGRVVGVNVCGGNATFPGVMGTTVFKTFEFNVAKTGLSMREAEKEGFHPVQAIVRGFDRAHYYPGRKESTLKVIADKETGRILGGQAVGEGPSDKFIDILAMALHGKMTCRELANVDLAYAPPFSPVLSPIIVAANVLVNKLEGKVEGIQASEVREKLQTSKENFQVLDVREEDEVKAERIPNTIWVPYGELKKRLSELDKSKEIAVHCESGLRSYKACLKLQHEGFENVKNIDGGMLCWHYDVESTPTPPSPSKGEG